MKVLISSLTYPLHNGVTNSVNTSIDGFVERGHEIKIVAPKYPMGIARPEHVPVANSKFSRFFLQLFGKEERMFGAKAKKQIERITHDFQPDVMWLHTVTWAPNAFERVMEEGEVPKVLTYHTLVELYGRTYGGEIGALRMAERSKKVCNIMDKIITPSSVIADKLRSYGVTKPIEVIPTGIPAPKRSFTKEEVAAKFKFNPSNKLLIFVGRISKEKNISALLRMVKELRGIRTDFTLLLVGPGDVDITKSEASSMGISDNIVLTGGLSADESKACYGAADIFVFASQSETQGLVIGEAMIAGTPVVALDSPIQKEIYPDDVAVVVRDESQFATEVDRVLNDSSLQEKLKIDGKAFVEKNFSIDGMITKQIAVLESVIKK